MIDAVAHNLYAEAISLGMVRDTRFAVGAWPNDSIRAAYRHLARAAVAAMREPSQQQMSTANLSFPPWGGHGEGPAPSQADMWRAMIDAILREEPK